MTASVSIREGEDGTFYAVNPNDRPVIENENRQSGATNSLEPTVSFRDRGGSYLRRLKIGQEFVGVLDAVYIRDYGIFASFGRFSIVLPDELETKLRPLQGQKIAILRYSDKDYSVIVLDNRTRTQTGGGR